MEKEDSISMLHFNLLSERSFLISFMYRHDVELISHEVREVIYGRVFDATLNIGQQVLTEPRRHMKEKLEK